MILSAYISGEEPTWTYEKSGRPSYTIRRIDCVVCWPGSCSVSIPQNLLLYRPTFPVRLWSILRRRMCQTPFLISWNALGPINWIQNDWTRRGTALCMMCRRSKATIFQSGRQRLVRFYQSLDVFKSSGIASAINWSVPEKRRKWLSERSNGYGIYLP